MCPNRSGLDSDYLECDIFARVADSKWGVAARRDGVLRERPGVVCRDGPSRSVRSPRTWPTSSARRWTAPTRRPRRTSRRHRDAQAVVKARKVEASRRAAAGRVLQRPPDQSAALPLWTCVAEPLDRLDVVRRIRNGGGHAEAEPDTLLRTDP